MLPEIQEEILTLTEEKTEEKSSKHETKRSGYFSSHALEENRSLILTQPRESKGYYP